MSDPFDQAIAMLNSEHVQARIKGMEADTAFVMGYMLAQVCGRCGDLLAYPDEAPAPEVKVTMLPTRKKRKPRGGVAA